MHTLGTQQDTVHDFYRAALGDLGASGVPFLVGGAFALESYTGLARRTKDLDVFIRPSDHDRLLRFLRRSGYRTEVRFPHWISKALRQDHCVDIIFGSGNGICAVDERWFESAPEADVLGARVRLVPVEEMIWSKAFIMERNRYDGADIAHLLHARTKQIDWARLLRRFNSHWRVLFIHLVLFGFVYPGHRLQIPLWLMKEMMRRLELETSTLPTDRTVCQGTLLSWSQYLINIEGGDYQDARHCPLGSMKAEETNYVTEVLTKEELQPTLHADHRLPPRDTCLPW